MEPNNARPLMAHNATGPDNTKFKDLKKVPEDSPAAYLWSLLDNIDTASDMFKPTTQKGYENFYKYAMNQAEMRSKHIISDGYDLYWKPAETV